MRIFHLHIQQAVRVAGEQHHLLQNNQFVALLVLTMLQVNGGKPTTGELKALHLWNQLLSHLNHQNQRKTT